MMDFIPMGDRVVIKIDKASSTSTSGIILTGQREPNTGIVMAVGTGLLSPMLERVEMTLKVGDHVLLGKYSYSSMVDINGEKFLVISESEVLGRFTTTKGDNVGRGGAGSEDY